MNSEISSSRLGWMWKPVDGYLLPPQRARIQRGNILARNRKINQIYFGNSLHLKEIITEGARDEKNL
jgi:hypothetical protein